MKKNDPIAPILSHLEEGDFYLEDEELFSNLLVKNSDQSYLSAKNLIIRDSHIQKLTMQKTILESFECSNVIFDHCDFSNLEWIGASFHQVTFQQCKLTGTNFAEGYLRDCSFNECLASMASFSNTNLKTVCFSDCQLEDTEFYEVRWKNLSLLNNQLTGSNWFRTSLKALDFRTNDFTKIALSLENLSGLSVDQEQALVIAASLGLIIEE
ncbi:pentapeptide repeat-containing protein [Enterococcus thailandicus]|uniref:pentapeptide repeat-containing protein n=1 Tax=Enterococcus thailandicus TaxID=417368 RepID=UPI0022EBD30D|nr:pentapeptide repeat-containing protein [Enterococcus thailandicus]MDA3974114.1 pentapeptide repeat-containing protein [Enterococcus thailandicus]MDA3976724.1 pentapeptide repeat-containing protein [Enterococcus thailandicus]MDA3981568.1 pentapeptide repeat-containing protein [Enterococcus thailandicus]